ncbi:MAG: ATP synthase F1 subunit delta [Pseudomonadota bacterium]
MNTQALSSRYAKALMTALGSAEAADLGLAALREMTEVFTMADAGRILKSPVMPKGFKKDLLEYCLDKVKADKTIYNFVGVLLESGRIELIPAITEQLKVLILASKNIAEGEVISAVHLDDLTMKHITEAAEQKLNIKLLLNQKIDPAVYGGFKVRVGNKLIDMSVQTKLDKLTAFAVQ